MTAQRGGEWQGMIQRETVWEVSNMQGLKNADEGWKFTWAIAWRLIMQEWEWTMPLKRPLVEREAEGNAAVSVKQQT